MIGLSHSPFFRRRILLPTLAAREPDLTNASVRLLKEFLFGQKPSDGKIMKSERESTAFEGLDAQAAAGSAGNGSADGFSPNVQRARAPVFVLGCPRSGTTLLYHMLLSAGGFAVYRTESSVFNVLKPCFGNLAKPMNRQRLMDAWIRSRLFERSGLDEHQIRAKVMADCRSPGDFMRIVMEGISRRQNADRWADCTPEHLLYIPEIKRAFPNALVIHIIRDGRDVALSLEKQQWIRPIFPRFQSGLLTAALYWEWMVRRGRVLGRAIPRDYLEVHFEELVMSPPETLRRIGAFIDQQLDYDRIQQTAIGSVNEPNTSFEMGSGPAEFAPAGRWKTALPSQELAGLEAILSGTLREFGYSPAAGAPRGAGAFVGTRGLYRSSFEVKLWLKKHTNLGRMFMKSDLSWL